MPVSDIEINFHNLLKEKNKELIIIFKGDGPYDVDSIKNVTQI